MFCQAPGIQFNVALHSIGQEETLASKLTNSFSLVEKTGIIANLLARSDGRIRPIFLGIG